MNPLPQQAASPITSGVGTTTPPERPAARQEKGYVMAATTQISLKAPVREIVEVGIKGTAPLIVHRWSEKAKEMMLAAQQGKKTAKQPKDPARDYEESMYRFDDGGHGFPVLGFKAATVTGAGRTFGKSVRMTELRLAMSFLADGTGTDGTQLTRITGEPQMREDMVRVGMGTADLRYRAEYRDWSAVLRIAYLPHMIDIESVVALVQAGGINGVGEWRPEKDGVFGTYEVVGA